MCVYYIYIYMYLIENVYIYIYIKGSVTSRRHHHNNNNIRSVNQTEGEKSSEIDRD